MRGLVRLYPPSWRERYGDEFDALLADTPPSARRTADALTGAARAWLRPARHLHSPAARMRSTISVVLYAWVALAAGVAVFAQLTEDPAFGSIDAAHPGAGAAHAAFRIAAAASLGLVALGVLPLVVALLLTARREHRGDLLVRLAAPLVAVLGFGIVLALVVTLAPRSTVPGQGIGNWFLVLLAAGLVAGFFCAHGPATAIRRAAPDERLLRFAVAALGGAIVAMTAAVIAAALYSRQLHTWLPTTIAAHPSVAGPFLAVLGASIVIATTSLTRGVRAARSATLDG